MGEIVEQVCNGFCPFKVERFGYDPPIPVPATTNPEKDGWAFIRVAGAEEGDGTWICPDCAERLRGRKKV